jgi:hypothetical protein
VHRAARAKDRIARIERGEDVAGGLGKPMTHADAICIMHSMRQKQNARER